jgi:enoyl-CoA hydratase/carnithine racemase
VAVDDLDAEISAICGAIGRNPRAALALTGLLRITERLPVVQGLLAESAVYSMLLAGPEFARWRARRPVRPLPLYERSPVGLRREGNVLHVTLDRPQRRNAFDRQMRDGLVDALDLVLVDPSIARVQLTGAGPAFCSGGDLDEFGTATDVTVAHLIRLERSVAARIARCRDRVSVHLHGACVGAGVELPAFAGAVSAEPDTMMSLPELRMGLVPGAGGTVGITRRIGRWRTAYLALRGEPLDAATACDWGLVDQVTS